MRRAVFMACAFAGLAVARAARAEVLVVDGDVRLRREDAAEARRAGERLPVAGGAVSRVAQRGETIAFQIVVVAGDRPIGKTELTLSEPVGPGGALLRTALFREHYLRVAVRSRNDKTPDEALGWHPGARPPDSAMLGGVPDALLPVAVDPRPVTGPIAVAAGATGAFWVDVDVPDGVPAGRYQGDAKLEADGAILAAFKVAIDVRPTPLPFGAVGVFIYYEAARLTTRMGGGGAAVERQLWRLLHAHHADAIAELVSADDVDRLASVWNGMLFTDATGYRGPGAGRPPAIVALGAYGELREPKTDALSRVDAMVGRLPAGPELFLYAIDESCSSPRAAEWQRALAAHPPPRRVAVAQTCDDPPAHQSVDIAMLSGGGGFTRATPRDARAAGKRAFIYNGRLPDTGTLMLDADPRGLVANGWIAAAMAIDRWFYWESIYWDDGYHGGHGAIDPFVTAETFHNNDGDSTLGDGLLLYPGSQVGKFVASSLGVDAVFPSIRLKAIRRGIEDAGLIALAAREQPEQTARIVARALPAALDEADRSRPASWESAPLSFAAARAALRDIVKRDAPMAEAEIRTAFTDLAARRAETVALVPRPGPHRRRARAALLIALGGALAFAIAARVRVNRRRSRA
jgi:hypothetical protein